MNKLTGHILFNGLKRNLYLLLAVHFLFVFCAVDLFHVDDCPSQNGNPFEPEDGCPACIFKQGAHAEQPVFAVGLGAILPIGEQVVVFVEQIRSVKPACHIYLRAPPAFS